MLSSHGTGNWPGDVLKKVSRGLSRADAQGVKWQYRKSANGGTDARVGTTCGSAAIAFGLAAPVRYIHCACNVAYLPDLEEVRKLAEIVIKEAGELDV